MCQGERGGRDVEIVAEESNSACFIGGAILILEFLYYAFRRSTMLAGVFR